jgi:hypothetical protein
VKVVVCAFACTEPKKGAVIASYAILRGCTLTALAFRLRSFARNDLRSRSAARPWAACYSPAGPVPGCDDQHWGLVRRWR